MVPSFKMVSNISHFVIFGIIVFANGNPVYRQDYLRGEPQYDLKKLIGEVVKQGKYDVMLNHHEDRPGTHHEDITQLTLNGGNSNNGKGLDNNSPPSTQNLISSLKKKPLRVVEDNNGDTNENSNEIFVSHLNNIVNPLIEDNLEFRCSGNRCGESRDGGNVDSQNMNDNDRHLRCNDKRCSIDIDRDMNGKDHLLCLGNSCSRNVNDRDDDDDRDILNNLRCIGDRCSINRVDGDGDDDDDDNDREGIYKMRCVGDRCGINRDDDDDDNDDDDDRDGLNSMRCIGDRCGINRDSMDPLRCIGELCSISRDDNNDVVGTLRCKSCIRDRNDDINDRNYLRCVIDRCGRNRYDDNRDTLRCIGNRCGRSRIDHKSQDISHEDQDDDEVEIIADNLRTNFRGKAIFEESDKRKVIEHLGLFLNNIKHGLVRIVHSIFGSRLKVVPTMDPLPPLKKRLFPQ